MSGIAGLGLGLGWDSADGSRHCGLTVRLTGSPLACVLLSGRPRVVGQFGADGGQRILLDARERHLRARGHPAGTPSTWAHPIV